MDDSTPVTTGRQSADWTNTLMNVLGGLGNTYLKGKYGQNDKQYVVGPDGKAYEAGVVATPITSASGGSTMTIVAVVAVVGVLAVLLLKD